MDDTSTQPKRQEQHRERDTNDAPWCWQAKHVMRAITENFSESGQAASARSAYVAMCELASDAGSACFRATKADIGHRAGLSGKTVERLLPGFEQLGIVNVERSLADAQSGAIKAPNCYTLLSMRLQVATSMRHGRQLSKSHLLKKEKEPPKQTRRFTTTHTASADAAAACPVLPKGFDRLFTEEQTIVQFYHATLVALGWLPVTRVTKKLRDALAARSPAEWKGLISGIATDSPNKWPKRRTLSNAHWRNY